MKVFGKFKCLYCNGTGDSHYNCPQLGYRDCGCKSGYEIYLQEYREGDYIIEPMRLHKKKHRYKWCVEISKLQPSDPDCPIVHVEENGVQKAWYHWWEQDVYGKDLKYVVKQALRKIRKLAKEDEL